MAPVWFISAASSGFGRAIALTALERGHTVIATARNVLRIQDLEDAGTHTMAFDVTSPMPVIEAVAKDVFHKFGRVDYLVNAAGYILEGAVEEYSPEEVYDIFSTNVFGIIHTLKAFLPYLRKQEVDAGGVRATVVSFGSLGSWVAGATFAAYAMTKWCTSALMEGLREELSPFNITATVIEPGYFRTRFLSRGAKVETKERMPAYEDESTPSGQARRTLREVDGNQPGDVRRGSKVVVDILTRTGVGEGKEVPVRIVLGSDCEQVIRDKCAQSLGILNEWRDVIRSTDYPTGE